MIAAVAIWHRSRSTIATGRGLAEENSAAADFFACFVKFIHFPFCMCSSLVVSTKYRVLFLFLQGQHFCSNALKWVHCLIQIGCIFKFLLLHSLIFFVFNNSIQTKMDRSVSSSESALSLKQNDGQIFGGDALVLVFFRCDALPILLESGQVDIVQ